MKMASKGGKASKNSQVQNSVSERRLRPIYGMKITRCGKVVDAMPVIFTYPIPVFRLA